MRHALLWSLVFWAIPSLALAETPSEESEEKASSFNAESVYDKPFLMGVESASLGGYVEGSMNYMREDGVAEGPAFELRRFNLFVHASIGTRMRLMSELEFEHGTEEIALEIAQIDYKIFRGLQFRFGILLPPIGAFNQNHDAPAWEFVDRPLVSTTIFPATLSEPGAGLFGQFLFGDMGLSYQVYATNGLGPGITSNNTGRTSIPAGKREGIFEFDNNPSLAVSGRLALRHFDVGELGLSGYWSQYNTYEVEGLQTDQKRSVTMLGLDYQTSFSEVFEARGEVGYAIIEKPEGAGPEIGSRQFGAHLDLINTVWRPTLFKHQEAEFNINLRAEYVDYNIGEFTGTGQKRGDEVIALVPGISFRPVSEAVIRANYRREWHFDLQRNAPAHRGVFQLGVATYF